VTVPELAAVLRLLPAPVRDTTQLGGAGRPWSIGYGAKQAILRWNDASRWHAFGFTDEEAVASIEWLHALLRDLASVGFNAPRPMDDLDGRSIAIVKGGIWELLSRVPGRQMGWSDSEIRESGSLLARFHEVALKLPTRPQRPGAQPFVACEPALPMARTVRAAFEREIAALDPAHAIRGVIHGDATQSNVVVGDDGSFRFVDFALAYQEHLYGDIGSALWRNGRSSADALTYDPSRAARFVRGYHAVRPLAPGAASAIVTFMKGRGLQLQRRLELQNGQDDSVIQRLLAVDAAGARIVDAIEKALS
jgi:Ser/Thr protein kinase RdoA (MazF antagonist)